jgi:hypothetical protein
MQSRRGDKSGHGLIGLSYDSRSQIFKSVKKMQKDLFGCDVKIKTKKLQEGPYTCVTAERKERVILPYVKVHPDRVVVYEKFEGTQGHRVLKEESLSNLKNNKRKAVISKKSAQKLNIAIEYLIKLANPKLVYSRQSRKQFHSKISFITLTLSGEQGHSDVFIKKHLINQFFVEAKRKWHVRYYVWKAEKQANGNFHIHITTNVFIPWQELRNTWNRIQAKAGYLEAYKRNQQEWHKNGFRVREQLLRKWPLKQQIKAYREGVKSGWTNPNSVDVHSVRNIANLPVYLKKYMSKSTQNEGIEGRLWGCCYELSNIEGFVSLRDSSIERELCGLRDNTDVKRVQGDWFTMFFIDITDLMRLGFSYLSLSFAKWFTDYFHTQLQLKLVGVW